MMFIRIERDYREEIKNKGQRVTRMEYRGKNEEWNWREMVNLIQAIFVCSLTLLRIFTELDPVVDNDTMHFAVMNF